MTRNKNRKTRSSLKKNRCILENSKKKRTHLTLGEAQDAIKIQNSRDLKPYFCKKCGGYHLTSRTSGIKENTEFTNLLSNEYSEKQVKRHKLDSRFDDLTLSDKLAKWAREGSA